MTGNHTGAPWKGRRPAAGELSELLARHRLWLVSSGANGVKANLAGADLRRVDLGVTNLERASLREADFAEANLQGANLRRADLGRANLQGASLRGANLERAALVRADLAGANLCGANLGGASLGGASLRGADLQGASLRGANLEGTDLQGANLEGTDLEGADLREAFLHEARLEGSQLDRAKLKGASLERKELAGAEREGRLRPARARVSAPVGAPVRDPSRATVRPPDNVLRGTALAQPRVGGRPFRSSIRELSPRAQQAKISLQFAGHAEPRTLQGLTRELATWTDLLTSLAHLQGTEPLIPLGGITSRSPLVIEISPVSGALLTGLAATWQAASEPFAGPHASATAAAGTVEHARLAALARDLELPLDPDTEVILASIYTACAAAACRGVALTLGPSPEQLRRYPRLHELAQRVNRKPIGSAL